MDTQLDVAESAAAVRQAVIEGRFEDMDQLLPVYTHAVASARSRELAEQARDLIEWARRTILANRATIAAQLSALPVPLPGYEAPEQRPTNTWQLEG